MFQSAPAIAGGRCLIFVAQNPTNGVSIRARHCWRAMLRDVWLQVGMGMFQSAPAIAGGRCDLHRLLRAESKAVSIRARHCWRAMREAVIVKDAIKLFQSAPAIAGGRCRERGGHETRHHRFNPRPPLLAGDAEGDYWINRARRVSIRARHCWRAMRKRRSAHA